MPIVWTTELATGIRVIDLQHQELVEMINTLEAQIDTQASLAELRPLIMRLQSYVLFHFSHEEGMMQREHLDESSRIAHCDEHKRFADQVAAAIAALNASTAPDTRGLLTFLRSWLVTHIMGTDQALAKQLPHS